MGFPSYLPGYIRMNGNFDFDRGICQKCIGNLDLTDLSEKEREEELRGIFLDAVV